MRHRQSLGRHKSVPTEAHSDENTTLIPLLFLLLRLTILPFPHPTPSISPSNISSVLPFPSLSSPAPLLSSILIHVSIPIRLLHFLLLLLLQLLISFLP